MSQAHKHHILPIILKYSHFVHIWLENNSDRLLGAKAF